MRKRKFEERGVRLGHPRRRVAVADHVVRLQQWGRVFKVDRRPLGKEIGDDWEVQDSL